ncbi:unnamed protein product [Ectocarpus sp. 13 AM-2016]
MGSLGVAFEATILVNFVDALELTSECGIVGTGQVIPISRLPDAQLIVRYASTISKCLRRMWDSLRLGFCISRHQRQENSGMHPYSSIN